MLNLFKRKKAESWEKDLLYEIFNLLPEYFTTYKQQIRDGLLNGVFFSDEPFSNYVGFTYDGRISGTYEDDNERWFCIKKISVYDELSQLWIEVIVYCNRGLVCGYSVSSHGKFKFINDKVQIQNFQKVYLDEDNFEELKEMLDEKEIGLINPSDFIELEIKGKIYFQIKELESGNFIVINKEKELYLFEHDDVFLKPLNISLSKAMSKY